MLGRFPAGLSASSGPTLRPRRRFGRASLRRNTLEDRGSRLSRAETIRLSPLGHRGTRPAKDMYSMATRWT